MEQGAFDAQALADLRAWMQAQAQVNAQAHADLRASMQAQAQANAQAHADLRASMQAHAQANAQGHADLRASMQAQAQANAQGHADLRASMQAQAQANAQSHADLRASMQAQAQANAQGHADLRASMQAQAQVNAQAHADLRASMQAQAQANAQGHADLRASMQAHAQANAQGHADLRASMQAQAQANVQGHADLRASMQAHAQANAQAHADLRASMQAQAQANAQGLADLRASMQAQAQANAQSQADLKACIKAQAQAHAQDLAERKTCIQGQVRAKFEAQARARAQDHAIVPAGELSVAPISGPVSSLVAAMLHSHAALTSRVYPAAPNGAPAAVPVNHAPGPRSAQAPASHIDLDAVSAHIDTHMAPISGPVSSRVAALVQVQAAPPAVVHPAAQNGAPAAVPVNHAPGPRSAQAPASHIDLDAVSAHIDTHMAPISGPVSSRVAALVQVQAAPPAVVHPAVPNSAPAAEPVKQAPGPRSEQAPESDIDLDAVSVFMDTLIDTLVREQFVQKLYELEFGSSEFLEVFEADEERFLNEGKVPITVCDDGFAFMKKMEEAKNQLNTVYLVKNKDGLGMEIPDLTFENLTDYISEETELAMIDVATQKPEMVELKKFIEIMAAPNKARRLNLLSLELSQKPKCEKLERAIKVPDFMAETCIISQITKELEERMKSRNEGTTEEEAQKASIYRMMKNKIKSYGKYLIMSVIGSLTDVHIDFSATSVYFHVITGQKIFYVALPTKRNLEKYEVIERGQLQSGWKGHLFERDFSRVVINAGETAFLPSGILHCVFTPEDTIAISGGFLQAESSNRHFLVSNFEQELVKVTKLDKEETWEHFHANMLTFVDLILLDKLRSGSGSDKKHEEHFKQGHIFLGFLKKYYNTLKPSQQRSLWVRHANNVLVELEKLLTMKNGGNKRAQTRDAGPPLKQAKN